MSVENLRAPITYPSELVIGTEIPLSEVHVRALRYRELNAKEAFTLVDSAGHFFRAAITSLDASHGRAKVYEAMATSTESPAHITLLCAVLGRQRMLGVIQKATELGASGVLPVLSERSVQAAGLAHEKAHAWPAQALRAARQCRRASIPTVYQAVGFTAALEHKSFKEASLRYYLDDLGPVGSKLERISERVSERISERTSETPQRIAFVVGPEGGFTDPERALLISKGAVPLRLGGRVLRAETAALVGLAFLQQVHGDM